MSIHSRLCQFDELANERWLGISTTEYAQQHDSERSDFRGYAPTSYRDWRVIQRHLTPKGAFIDYGAGLGRVTILAARLPFECVIGLDLDPDLVERGNQNINHARGLRCPVSIISQDAATFDIPDNTSVLYFNNPFSGSVLAAVLENVRKSQRALQLVCNVPPISGFEREIRAVPWLTLKTELSLSDKRKCLIFTRYGYTTP